MINSDTLRNYTDMDWQGMIVDLLVDYADTVNNTTEEFRNALDVAMDMAMTNVLDSPELVEDFYEGNYAIYILNQQENLSDPEGTVWRGDRNTLDKHNQIRALMLLPPYL